MPDLELRITNHTWYAPKYLYSYYGDRELNSERGRSGKYRHAKFRLPSGKPKCIRFGDISDEEVLAAIRKQFSNFSFVLAPQPSIQ